MQATDFSTPCCASAPECLGALGRCRAAAPPGCGPQRERAGRWALAWALLLLGIWLTLGCAGAARASSELEHPLSLQRSPDGLLLSARLVPELPADLEAVLLRGVPVHFVWQAEVRRPRWYWSAAYVGSAQRVVRVAYQPLTRRWRVSVATGPVSEITQAGALHQNLDSFAEAMAAATSVSRWVLLPAEALPAAAALRVDFELRLDDGLLPRPFQITPAGKEGWGLLLRDTLRLGPGAAP